jgi:hypothetical protein
MRTAGVIIDFYDDLSGETLRRTFPDPTTLPESVKVAHLLSPDERNVLRDEAFALILHNEGNVMRKFACVDEGNTILSCLYFEENAEILPEEAIKTAAANLAHFCQQFGMEPTPFIKMAASTKDSKPPQSASGRVRDSMKQPLVGDEADWAARTNLVSVRGGADSGRVIPTANQMKTAEADDKKKTDYLESWKKLNPEYKKTKKAAGPLQKLLGGGEVLTDDVRFAGPNMKHPKIQNFQERNPSVNNQTLGVGAEQMPINLGPTLWPAVGNRVDVTGKQPLISIKKASATITALDGKYSLDSYADVQAAVQFFEDNWTQMTPEDRHEFAVKTASRAEDLDIGISELLERYGSTSYSPDIEAQLSARKANCDAEFHELFDSLKEKRAGIEPEQFVQLLGEADEVAGLHWYYGGKILDPYLSTYGGMSEKKASAAWTWMSSVGDTVNIDQLKSLAKNGRGSMKKVFSDEIINAFQKDPVAIFESLPDPSKIIMCRLAHDGEFDSLPGN